MNGLYLQQEKSVMIYVEEIALERKDVKYLVAFIIRSSFCYEFE